MKCEKQCEIYSRVCGYYRPVNQWNRGKQEEFKDRKTFDSCKETINDSNSNSQKSLAKGI